jgi:hypothetical protein
VILLSAKASGNSTLYADHLRMQVIRTLRFRFFLLFLSLFCANFMAKAADQQLVVICQDAATRRSLAFPILSIEGDSSEILGDMEGIIRLAANKAKGKRIKVRAYQYLPTEALVEGNVDTLRLDMNYAHSFTWQHHSLRKDKQRMDKILKARNKINPGKEQNYQYQSYNKLLLTTSDLLALKLYLNQFLRFATKTRLGEFALDHHIFLMESSSERRYHNSFNQRETVRATQLSGISKPAPLSYVSGFDPSSIFEPFLRIGHKKYISPLAGRPFRRYVFSLIDSIRSKSGMVYVVKFNPKSNRPKNLLQGFLFVATAPSGIMAFHIWPAYDRESIHSLAQQSMILTTTGRWFPQEIRNIYQSEQLGSIGVPLTAISKTWISGFSALQDNKIPFDEVIFDLQAGNLRKDSVFPPQMRLAPLDKKEENTYRFYKLTGSLDGVDRILNFGQKLYEGKFQAGKTDILFQDAIKINDHEGIRLGLGLETNEKLSRRIKAGGYFAYGFRDEAWKFGMHSSFKLSDRNEISMNWKRDLSEPGMFPMAFERRSFLSGDLRNLRVSRFDAIQSVKTGLRSHISRNLNAMVNLELGERTFLYNYQYKRLPGRKQIGISELSASLCWNPGERYARLEQQLYPVVSGFPVLWLQYSRGISGILPASFSYDRLETRMQWNRKILGVGELGIRLSAGIQNAALPYPLLFSGPGSYREFSLVSFNSFETMRYNEFFYNQYFHVFIAHQLGKMQISTLPFLPYFTLVHNMGWGSLQQAGLHEGIKSDDIRKGYFESGAFLNDLFVIPLSGLDLGIGAGLFVRYGPYSYNSLFENMVLKFSASLGI